MNVFRLLARTRRARAELATALRQVRAAEQLLGEARDRARQAHDAVEQQRDGQTPSASTNPTRAERELITAVDDWLRLRKELQQPVSEAQRTLNAYAEALEAVKTRRSIARRLLARSTRALFPEQVVPAETALSVLTRVVDSHLSRRALEQLARRRPDPAAALARYRRNNAYFVAALEHLQQQIDIDFQRPSITGHLPLEVASRVEATPLLSGGFTSFLRRYQEFGARYAIAQKRIILGDEMGLGKTVQALAAICHVRSLGARNILVVAPNSVMVNWERETTVHTTLEPIVLHGPTREALVEDWRDSGRVGITTFGTFPKIAHLIDSLDVLVVDEAHHVKNPDTQRATAIQQVAEVSDHVILMTGTPLENRLSEFQSLAVLAQPELRPSLDDVTVQRFPDPEIVATVLSPVYLRRTQSDVLDELPERIHTDEMVDLTDDDHRAYLLAAPNLMSKRLAATVGDEAHLSAKFERMSELVDDHRDAGHKIVVFSFFRKVVAEIADMLGTDLVITGDSSPTARQGVIDAFADAEPGAVLVAQVEAGGVGVNLQMAQAVIMMEPQFKPSTEWQAVARVHRMGQTRPVAVHRLIARGTVDEHLVNLIAAKEQEFFAYAHDSAVKHESAMAMDTRESSLESELQRLLDSGEIS